MTSVQLNHIEANLNVPWVVLNLNPNVYFPSDWSKLIYELNLKFLSLLLSGNLL